MTSSNGNIFRVTGPLCGEFTDPGDFPTQRPVTRSFGVFFDLRLNKRLSKQPWGWWFETPSSSLWRHCNAQGMSTWHIILRHIVDMLKVSRFITSKKRVCLIFQMWEFYQISCDVLLIGWQVANVMAPLSNYWWHYIHICSRISIEVQIGFVSNYLKYLENVMLSTMSLCPNQW